jgi:hypothetical protein
MTSLTVFHNGDAANRVFCLTDFVVGSATLLAFPDFAILLIECGISFNTSPPSAGLP